jgi:hypothetical protein
MLGLIDIAGNGNAGGGDRGGDGVGKHDNVMAAVLLMIVIAAAC